jgi:hypothetical protein
MGEPEDAKVMLALGETELNVEAREGVRDP